MDDGDNGRWHQEVGQQEEYEARQGEGMKSSIAKAFVAAQRGFAPALKTSTNPHFKSRYADLAACVEAVLDSLNEHGIALMQHTHEQDGGVMIETVFLHESGETLSGGKLFVPASKMDAQGYGSALSYARRYSLMAACGIAPEDDDGNAAAKSAPQQRKPAGKVFGGEDLKTTLDYVSVAESQKALHNLYDQAKAAGANPKQLEVIERACLEREQALGLGGM